MTVRRLQSLMQRWLMAVAACLLVLPVSFAQERQSIAQATGLDQPTIVVAFNGLNKLVPDIMYLMTASGQPPMMGGMINVYANQFSQGMDRDRPIGIAVNIKEDGSSTAYLLLPIADLKTFFDGNAQFVTQSEISDNRYQLNVGMQAVYAQFQDGWLHVTQNESDLDQLISSPEAMLARLSSRYDVAANVRVKALPEGLREQLMTSIEQGFENAMAQGGSNMSPEELEKARENGKRSIEQIKEYVDNTDQVLIGLNIDKAAKVVALDFGNKFVEGSKMAKQTEMQRNLQSVFASTIPESSPIQVKGRSKLSAEDAKTAVQDLEAQLGQVEPSLRNSINDPKQREIFVEGFEILTSAAKSAVAAGEFDFAYSMNFDNGLNTLGGGLVGNGSELETKLVAYLNKYQSDEAAPKLDGSPTKVGNFNVYSGNFPTPGNNTDAQKFFGESLPFSMAFSDKAMVFTTGSNHKAAIEQAVKQISGGTMTDANPMDAQIEITPILEYASTMQEDGTEGAEVLEAVIAKGKQFADSDAIQMTSRAVDNGVIVRLSIEEGVLQMIGAAVQEGQKMQAGQ